MAATIINRFGKVAGWNSIKLRMLGRDVEGITEIEYDDNVDKENIMGAGGYPVGRGEGNYEGKASITLLHEEIVALQQSLGPGKRLTDIAPFDIVVRYTYNGFAYKDVIRNAEFLGNARSVKQNDKSITNKFDLIISHIEWNEPI
jgi:hypothetical protein